VRRFPSRIALCLSLFAGLAVALAGCAAKSPEERVAELRGKYDAALNGFVVKSRPAAAEPVAAGEAATAGEETAAGGADDGMAIEELPVTSEVMLDIVVRSQSNEVLPGLTLDVSQVDGQKREKGHWRIWVNTSKILRGPGTQVTHVLPGVDYEEGDGFHVEVRRAVPAEERAEYREFAGAP
jgi:hypothetical protein